MPVWTLSAGFHLKHGAGGFANPPQLENPRLRSDYAGCPTGISWQQDTTAGEGSIQPRAEIAIEQAGEPFNILTVVVDEVAPVRGAHAHGAAAPERDIPERRKQMGWHKSLQRIP